MQGMQLGAFAVLFGILIAVKCDGVSAQQKYPVKPVRLIVSNTPGSTPDILARLIGPKLSEAWGQPVVIENRPGAGGVIAATLVARAAPDGYTLTLLSPAFAIRTALIPNLPYDSLKELKKSLRGQARIIW